MPEMKKVSVEGKDMIVMPEQIEALRQAGHEVKVPTRKKITPAMAATLKKEAEEREKESKKTEPEEEGKAPDSAVESVMKKVKKSIEKK